MTAPLFDASSPLQRLQPVASRDRMIAWWLIAVCVLLGLCAACAAAVADPGDGWELLRRAARYGVEITFILPLLLFRTLGPLPAAVRPKALAVLALGALQGTLSWWAGAYGWEFHPLARMAHVGLAATMLILCLWGALDLLAPWRRLLGRREGPLFRHALLTLALSFSTVIAGAYGDLHWAAALGAVSAAALWGRSRQVLSDESGRRAIDALAAMAWVQGSLGLFVTLDHNAPATAMGLAAAHQAGGMLLIGLGTLTLHRLRRGR